MKIRLLKILLWGILFLLSVNAVELKEISKGNLSLRIEKLNKQINIEGIDTLKLTKEYQNIFSDIKDLKSKGKVSQVLSLYIRLAQGMSDIKLHNIIFLLKRMVFEEILIKEIEETLDSNIFSKKLQRNLRLVLEKELILTKEPLIDTIKNDGKELLKSIRKTFIDKNQNLSEKQLKSVQYIYDYSCKIIREYIKLQIDAVMFESFADLNQFFMELDKKITSFYKKKNTKESEKEIANVLVYSLLMNSMNNIYKEYMISIDRNKKLLEKMQ